MDFKIYLRVGFGDNAESMKPYADNSMQAKTQSVIALGNKDLLVVQSNFSLFYLSYNR